MRGPSTRPGVTVAGGGAVGLGETPAVFAALAGAEQGGAPAGGASGTAPSEAAAANG